MKNLIFSGLTVLAVGLTVPQIIQGQGTTYISNLALPPSGALAVGSNSWLAADFITGTNAGGYVLNLVQLAITDASGNPNGFTAMLYGVSSSHPQAVLPGSSLGSFTGPSSPALAGTYTYTAPAGLALSPNTPYFIVLTAGTRVANGAYEWSVKSTPTPGYNSYHWGGPNSSPSSSSDGLQWSFLSGGIAQFAVNATPVPEPSGLGLFVLDGISLLCLNRKRI